MPPHLRPKQTSTQGYFSSSCNIIIASLYRKDVSLGRKHPRAIAATHLAEQKDASKFRPVVGQWQIRQLLPVEISPCYSFAVEVRFTLNCVEDSELGEHGNDNRHAAGSEWWWCSCGRFTD